MLDIHDAYSLFHRGNLVFANMHETGVRVDVDYLRKAQVELTGQLDNITERLMAFPEVARWRQREGQGWSLDSQQQLARLLFDDMKLKPVSGRSVSGDVLAKLDIPFGNLIREYRKIKDARDTFINGLLQEQVDGVVRASIALVLVSTFRSSCSGPNLQNQPTRDDFVGRIVRSAFIPDKGMQFTEYDFKGMELCGQATISQDKNMMRYMEGHADGSLDLHWDMACLIFKLGRLKYDSKKHKKIRYNGKNGFVFPETYGDWWASIAAALWEAAATLQFNGKPMREWLTMQGIQELGQWRQKSSGGYETEPGTFYHHVRSVEDHFWNDMFPDLHKWRLRCWNEYCRDGMFTQITGFPERGLYSRNQCINHRIQGPAFHILLWSLTELDWELRARNIEAYPVLQVHDSILVEHTPEAVTELDPLVVDIATRRVKKEWDWIKVPLVIEAERSPIGGSWWDKKEVEL